MKTFRIFSLTAVMAVTSLLNAQVKIQESPVIMTVNGKPVTKAEFEAIFRKNYKDATITRESLDEYLVLFTNFKLKVTEAEELGLDTAKKFRDELAGYRRQLARPYLVDNQLSEELITEAYERMKWEVRASHILIKVDWEADPKDSLAAYNRALALRNKIIKGMAFEKVAAAKDGSEDESVRVNKGDLGFFSAFDMVYNFETACYNMKVGDLSMPVRTRFGYHIIKLTDKRPARGTIKVAHILIASKKEDTPEKQADAKKRAEEIREKIIRGESFATLASQFSDDQSSNRKGGELAPFGTRKMVPEFEDASFALMKDGDISPLIKTDYGYHIIKRLELKPIPTFEEVKGTIKQRVQRDSRSQLPKKSFVNKLKVKYNFTETPGSLAPFYAIVDTNIFYGTWDVKKASHLMAPMFSFNGKNYSQADFAQFLYRNQRRQQKDELNTVINSMYSNFVNNTLMDYEDSRLEEIYPEFYLLMKEYRDGILLFELTDMKVWSKAVKDSSGLASYYEKNKTKYMWPKRYDVEIYYAATAEIAKMLSKDLKKAKMTEKDLLDKYNKDSQLNLKIVSGVLTEEENEFLKANQPVKAGLSKVIPSNGQHVILKTRKVLEPQPKTIAEAKGVITSDYQNYLEQEWISSLKAKYPVVINKEVLYSIK
jgi:peptidyl-prolyl cis-trans isomerase SurA